MKRLLWLPLTVGLLLALAIAPAGCIRERSTPSPSAAKLNLAPTATQAASVIAPLPTETLPSAAPVEGETPEAATGPEVTPTPVEVEVVTEPTSPAQPAGSDEPASPTEAPGSAPSSMPAASSSETSYQVRWGDTLSGIASRFGTTISAIVARNPQIGDRNHINAGSVLVIPTGGAAPSSGSVARETGDYVIRRGDTLASIARRFGVSIAALKRANPSIVNINYIRSGRHLVIPAGGDWKAERTHVVRAGETLSAIARLYNASSWAIMVRNNLANGNLIYAGQVLVIP